MSDRRRIIAALRAKAASTTFPAEAEALRSKANALEAKLAAGQVKRPTYAGQGTTVRDVQDAFNRASAACAAQNAASDRFRFESNRFFTIFEEMGGIVVNDPATPSANPIKVRNVNGQTYWITVE